MTKTKWLCIFLIAGVAGYYFYPENKLPDDSQIDRLVVTKSKRQLAVYSKGTLLKTYKVSLGRVPEGDKEFEGDMKTPEGIYFINDKNPNSGYHKNLGISYPNQRDIEHARSHEKPAGGDIKIHGLRNGIGLVGKFHRWFDWTMGCIAVTNDEMDELYEAVEVGTSIEIRP
ncbi:MAG: murein L,D-transpeptidase family protein [Cryomorphaceae bacterium]|nr:L,D-transpeptidase family protein [Flavobacteriales bacterium]